ncbi:MAG TPA: DNA mismatch repair protein MutS [Edaphocola sp.]|nr:DNA mismatch repair protein MutS [Edaphocola sp.]
MQIDETSLKDLSIFKGVQNVFGLVNHCTSHIGVEKLKNALRNPPNKFEELLEVQNAVKYWEQHLETWETSISNGTLVMLQGFFETSDGLQYKPSTWMFNVDTWLQKLFNKNAFSLLQFSVFHLIDLVHGLNQLIQIKDEKTPILVQNAYDVFEHFLALDSSKELLKLDRNAPLKSLLHAGYQARRTLKSQIGIVMQYYGQLDAWHSMAKANAALGLIMPQLIYNDKVSLKAEGLFHPLLKKAVSYDIELGNLQNLLFLTGANMSGKSTLLRSIGVSALLAHVGMGVPAKAYRISFLEGIVSNMQIEDDIFKGESYFYAEVQRVKQTALKIKDSSRYLVLMDELFKGTNVHDAYECSKAVIQLLARHQNSLMALSTHLYELYEELKTESRITFKYLFTQIDKEGKYTFTYQLKEGVSNDKIGFLVLKQEGVLDILGMRDEG